jgi:2,4-dienoyl-CoA reductase-like NADH-dependent reductase (Old Yellow Enzyme family)
VTHSLFQSYSLNSHALKNRVVIAPMARNRALENLPNALMAEYYGQRSGAGLIMLDAKQADLVSFGSSFLAKPDLVERMRANSALNSPRSDLFYLADAKGYTDYPVAGSESH